MTPDRFRQCLAVLNWSQRSLAILLDIASAIFLIIELSTPYFGVLRLSPSRSDIEALGK